ncbi:DUF6266 family protein [Sphingobacterium sp. ML3W]|uniref:DUF6266 family protein n=1 Tax=Sphingobacterium sp. ML3W TaxID=1538644 RepID=UPI00068F1FD0|nr:DUF6266 family protein [Sphingobacterium sp. ML3W]
MGTILQGALGGFSGKAGAIIGSSWKSINYIKGLSKKRTKPATEEQLMQQARFYTIAKFIMPIASFVNLGFGQVNANRMTATNVALQANINTAVVGTYPNFTLDYSKILISKGGLQPGGMMWATGIAGILKVNWSPSAIKIQKGELDDQVHILLYVPTIDEFLTAPEPPVRGDGSVDIEFPEHFNGEVGHVWVFFADRKGKRVSKTTYLGEVELS